MFVADVMLKKLARWLRILGFSVIYPDFVEDEKIINITKSKRAILLTMDAELYERAKKNNIESFLVPRSSIENQISAIIKQFNLKIDDFPSKTLCPQCNGKLDEVFRELVNGKIHPQILKRHQIFWLCKKCGKVFWEGSHWKKITKTVNEVKKLVGRFL